MVLNNIERRSEPRHPYFSSIEFSILPDKTEENHIGTTINISNSGLAIYSYVPLSEGQDITIKSAFPSHHKTYTVRWVNELLKDFFVVGLRSKE